MLSAQERVHVQLVDTAHPTIFLLTSGDAGTLAQAMRCAARFDHLGYAVVPVKGLAEGMDLSSYGVPAYARRGHLAWLLCFFPKLRALTADLNQDDKFWWPKILVGQH